MTENEPKYLAYLLRMWQVEERHISRSATKAVWRVSLENVYTHTRYGFTSLERTFAFLYQQTVQEREDYDEAE